MRLNDAGAHKPSLTLRFTHFSMWISFRVQVNRNKFTTKTLERDFGDAGVSYSCGAGDSSCVAWLLPSEPLVVRGSNRKGVR